MEKITERKRNIAEWKIMRMIRYAEKHSLYNGKIRGREKVTIAEKFSHMNKDRLYM